MLKEYEEVQKIGAPNPVAWTEKLFAIEESKSLPDHKVEQFYVFTAKSLFASKRARPDIQPAAAFLCTCVQKS